MESSELEQETPSGRFLTVRASAELRCGAFIFTADERAELIDLGACHVFKKPFSPKTFAAELIRIYQER